MRGRVVVFELERLPGRRGTGFGLNALGPSEKAPMLTVMFGPPEPVLSDAGVEPPDELPPLTISKAPAMPPAVSSQDSRGSHEER